MLSATAGCVPILPLSSVRDKAKRKTEPVG